jgi:hypothetical protein
MGKILLVLFIMADSTTPGLDESNRFGFLLFNPLMFNAAPQLPAFRAKNRAIHQG